VSSSASERPSQLIRNVQARIPTAYGTFFLYDYTDQRNGKEHLALVMGDVAACENVLVRVHSECMTGDTFRSLRCDCGEQLHMAMERIAMAKRGVLIYLRQEGRGIGLIDKLRAYNLQDKGYDTVEANLLLGHQADEREYWAAAAILEDLGVRSVHLLTNNPAKIEALRSYNIPINERVPLQPTIHAENATYLRAKVARMRHLLQLPPAPPAPIGGSLTEDLHRRLSLLQERIAHHSAHTPTPHVTLAYAQSLDGSLTATPGTPLTLSGAISMTLTHALRSLHDAILVGVGTVLADDPRLTVRLIPGRDPQPVVLDSALRTPPTARLFDHPRKPWILTTARSDEASRRRLSERGAEIILLPADATGRVSLPAALDTMKARGVQSVMVEGGAQVLESFVAAHLAHYAVITLAPRLVGGLHAFHANTNGALPHLAHVAYTQAGDDLIVWGEPIWMSSPDKMSETVHPQ